MKEAVVASEVLEDENMKVDLPIEQMEVREVEEEPNSYNDFKNHQNAALSTRSSPSRTNKISEYTSSMKESRDLQPNSHGESKDQSLDQQEPKDTKGEEISSKKYGIRSHTSTFLKEKKKVTLNCGPNGV